MAFIFCLLESWLQLKKEQPKQSALYKQEWFCFYFPSGQITVFSRVRIFDRKWNHFKVLQFFCLVRLKLWTKWIISCWMARQTLSENGYGEWLLDIFGFCHVLSDLAYSFRLISLCTLLQDCACKFCKNPNCEFFSELFWGFGAIFGTFFSYSSFRDWISILGQ